MEARRQGTHPLMVLVGASLLVFYASLAYLSYRALVALWSATPGLETILLVVAVGTLVVGYLSYRFGTAQLLSGLEAVELPRSRAPGFYRRFDRLVDRMDAGDPQILVAQLPTPNAFALGSPRSGVVVLDRSLFRLLTVDELEAIVAHELAHLEGYDAFVQTLAYTAFRTLVGFALLASFPVVLVIGGFARAIAWMRGRPASWTNTLLGRLLRRAEQAVLLVSLAFTVVVLARSRRREYAADDRAVTVTGRPLALARALRKIQRAAEPDWGLLSPLYVHTDETETEDERLWRRLLSTHPSTDERIDRLVERARTQQNGRRRREGERIPVR